MANHRMLSNRVANSAKFLQMPAESQLLFFHMILRADDDGVVESYPLMKLLGFAPDNFKILTAKGFIKQLNEDQVVVIADWLEHNKIRADRKVDSIYLPSLLQIYPDTKIVVAKPRTDVLDNSRRVDGPRSAEGKLSKVSKKNFAEPKFLLSKNELKTVPELKEGTEPKQLKGEKNRIALQLRGWCYEQIEKTYGDTPTANTGDYIQLIRALKKLKESDIKLMMQDALAIGKGRTVRGVFTDREVDLYKQENV